MPVAAHMPLASKGSFLISTNVGIMIWTIVVFAISLFILRRAVFPRIGEALDKRAKTIEGDIDAAEQLRTEADKVLEEYRERLKEARSQSDEIVQRARQAAETHEHESKERGRELIAEASQRAQREIETATKRALDDLRREVVECPLGGRLDFSLRPLAGLRNQLAPTLFGLVLVRLGRLARTLHDLVRLGACLLQALAVFLEHLVGLGPQLLGSVDIAFDRLGALVQGFADPREHRSAQD